MVETAIIINFNMHTFGGETAGSFLIKNPLNISAFFSAFFCWNKLKPYLLDVSH